MNNLHFNNTTFIAPGAQVIGNVSIGENSSVWHNAVIRGDMAEIRIGKGTNIQDNCTLHCDKGAPLIIGDGVTVGHNAVLHSCTVGGGSLIGMGAVLLSGCRVGKNAIVAAGSLLTSSTVVPDGALFMGSPAKLARELTDEEIKKNSINAAEYASLAKAYLRENNKAPELTFKACEGLTSKNLDKITTLAKKCEEHDKILLKLSLNMLKHRNPSETNDFLCFDGSRLVGFIGIYQMSTGNCEAELTGMVDPDYRRLRIFTRLFNMAIAECKKRRVKTALLITNSGCSKGADFALKNAMNPDHSELVMLCDSADWQMSDDLNLTFRRALTSDVKEMAYLDMLGFNCSIEEAEGYYTDFTNCEYYIAQFSDKPVGHIGLIRDGDKPLVCGLVVSPVYRRRGFGREILDYCLDIIYSDGYTKARLEVDCDNKTAISIYRKAGFKECDRYDYFERSL